MRALKALRGTAAICADLDTSNNAKRKLRRALKPILAGIVSAPVLFAANQQTSAATLYWDTDGSTSGDNTSTGAGLGGSGSWSTAVANWYNGTSLVVWTEG